MAQTTLVMAGQADAACIAELFSGGRLWKTFTEHVSEFDAWLSLMKTEEFARHVISEPHSHLFGIFDNVSIFDNERICIFDNVSIFQNISLTLSNIC